MRVALVHDWLVGHRGGEQVLLELARMYPQAPIFTLVCDRSRLHPELQARTIIPSKLQGLPGAPRRFRHWLPFFSRAIEEFDVAGFELVISTSHCVAKGIRTHRGQVHLSYIHTPMRYIWDEMESYLPRGPWRPLLSPVASRCVAPLRRWDVETAGRPDVLLANSVHIRDRIARVWGRTASVVYPPVDTDFFVPSERPRSRELLVVGAQVPYKNTSLAVQCATEDSLPLRVIGDGPALADLQKRAGPTVVFEPSASRERVRQAYQHARALLFCGKEDFGIVPVEAMACGCPVVALARGGALESVVETGLYPTGVLFREPSLGALRGALRRLDALERRGLLDDHVARARAARFSMTGFRDGVDALVKAAGL